MSPIARFGQSLFFERHPLVAALTPVGARLGAREQVRWRRHASPGRSACARKRRKEVVEAAVLLDHHDDVLDVFGAAPAAGPRIALGRAPNPSVMLRAGEARQSTSAATRKQHHGHASTHCVATEIPNLHLYCSLLR